MANWKESIDVQMMFLLNLGTQDPKPQIDQVGGIILLSEKSKFVKELQV